MTPNSSKPRVFGVDYQFLSCGDVFTRGLENAARELGVEYHHADWSAPRLGEMVGEWNPDLLLVVHGRQFCGWQRPSLLGAKRTAIWLLDEPYEVDDTARFSAQFDQVFVNDRATMSRHPGAVYLPVCYDQQIHHSGDGHRPRAVGFIGGANGSRNHVLSTLARAGALSYVVGGRWSDAEVDRLCLSPNIPPPLAATLYRETKIVVNIFRDQHHFNRDQVVATAMNPRIYEALACGTLVISEWRAEIAERVPELPTFHSAEECVDLVRGFLGNPSRLAEVQAACAARLAGDTYAARLQTVLQTMAVEVAA